MQTTIVIKDREAEVRSIAIRLARASPGRLSDKALMDAAEQVMRNLEDIPVSNLLARIRGGERLAVNYIASSNRLRIVS